MNINNHIEANKYLNDKMSETEKQEFEERLLNDDETKANLEFWQKFRERIEQKERNDNFRKLSNKAYQNYSRERKKEKRSPKIKRLTLWISSAAAVIAIAVTAWFLMDNKKSLYETYANRHPSFNLELVHRGGGGTQYDGKSFNEGDYDTAYQMLGAYIKNNPSNQNAQMAYGISAMELGLYDEAESILKSIHKGNSELSINGTGTWHLAMCYLKQNKKEECIHALEEMPMSSSSKRKKLAKELIERLKD